MVISKEEMKQNALIVCDGLPLTVNRNWGWLLLAAGLVFVMVSFMQSSPGGSGQEMGGFGGVILIGPIPIVFGSSPEMALGSMLLALLILSLSYLLMRRRD
jgi:uncharacterized protein (TIGR00304 family)